MSLHDYPRPDRRTAIKWMLTAAASLALLDRKSLGAAMPPVKGYGFDVNLNRDYQPGDFWALTFNDAQRRTAAALCGTIIPADDQSPSAASLRVHDFIDEWISAPYPDQQKDRPRILDGLAWIEGESQRRFAGKFADLEEAQREKICADICHAPDARAELTQAAHFFERFRDLTAGGFYTTPAGMKDLKYIGNMPLAEFKGPPLEVLKKIGLA